MAELLLAHGAKLDPALLFITVDRHRSAGELMTKFLLDKGLDPNTTSERWGTLLHLAVSGGNPRIVKLLLDAGADSTVQSIATGYFCQTSMQIAQNLDADVKQSIVSLLQSSQAQA